MAKFKEVKDFMTAKNGDVLVIPKGVKLSVNVLRKMGLSVGDTTRAHNGEHMVAKYLSGDETKLFMFCLVYAKDVEPGENLLGMGAYVKAVERDPEFTQAAIVPFLGQDALEGDSVPDSYSDEWNVRRWAGCWNDTHSGAVIRRLHERYGKLLMGSCGYQIDDDLKDACANRAWDGPVGLIGRMRTSSHTTDTMFPCKNRVNDADPFAIDRLMQWQPYGNYTRHDQRIQFRWQFFKRLAAKGAKVYRPDQKFVDAMTDNIVAWYARVLAKEYKARVQGCQAFIGNLRKDIARDKARAREYAKARSTSSVAKALEKII